MGTYSRLCTAQSLLSLRLLSTVPTTIFNQSIANTEDLQRRHRRRPRRNPFTIMAPGHGRD
jgi:hypothetical protein